MLYNPKEQAHTLKLKYFNSSQANINFNAVFLNIFILFYYIINTHE